LIEKRLKKDWFECFFCRHLAASPPSQRWHETTRYGLLFHARRLATCKQGLVALAPHIEILNLSIPCVVCREKRCCVFETFSLNILEKKMQH
jgi:hypothetical protein